jgi:hypothetical protein
MHEFDIETRTTAVAIYRLELEFGHNVASRLPCRGFTVLGVSERVRSCQGAPFFETTAGAQIRRLTLSRRPLRVATGCGDFRSAMPVGEHATSFDRFSTLARHCRAGMSSLTDAI